MIDELLKYIKEISIKNWIYTSKIVDIFLWKLWLVEHIFLNVGDTACLFVFFITNGSVVSNTN